MDSAPTPEEVPALPLRAGDSASDASFGEWVRTGAEHRAAPTFGEVQSAPFLAAGGRPPGWWPSTAAGSSSQVGPRTWVLLTRGVGAYLTVLAVARC